MNIIVWLEFKLTHSKSAVQHFCHYTSGTPLSHKSKFSIIISLIQISYLFLTNYIYPSFLQQAGCDTRSIFNRVWVLFNGISTSVGHLMPRKVRLVLSSMQVLGHGFGGGVDSSWFYLARYWWKGWIFNRVQLVWTQSFPCPRLVALPKLKNPVCSIIYP